MFSRQSKATKGKVYLVGAGPGDPDLLTVKAVNRLRCADIVLHDALVSSDVLALIPSRARVVNVGKRCGRKSITQAEINRLLVQYVSNGDVVVRLKSGDPLIFGRAGEELETLQKAGIEVEVVPGVTAAVAAAATAKVSLTDRRSAEQLLFISAHRGNGKTYSDWFRLVTNRTTVVVYMPGEFVNVAEDLVRAGLSRSTPCVIISNASRLEEQSYQTILGSLHRAPTFPPPCVLIVGEAIGMTAPPELLSLRFPALQPQSDRALGSSAEP